MAWVAVTGSGGIWEYENTATKSDADTYSDSNGTVANGIRHRLVAILKESTLSVEKSGKQ